MCVCGGGGGGVSGGRLESVNFLNSEFKKKKIGGGG